MTASLLQEAIINELKVILRNMRFPSAKHDLVEINIYNQLTPLMGREDEEKNIFPYIIVKVDSGEFESEVAKATVLFIIGIYDTDKKRQAHKYILSIIDKIYQRFAENSILDHQFRASMDMEYELQKDETFPRYFGAMQMEFELGTVRREDEFT